MRQTGKGKQVNDVMTGRYEAKEFQEKNSAALIHNALMPRREQSPALLQQACKVQCKACKSTATSCIHQTSACFNMLGGKIKNLPLTAKHTCAVQYQTASRATNSCHSNSAKQHQLTKSYNRSATLGSQLRHSLSLYPSMRQSSTTPFYNALLLGGAQHVCM